MTSRQADKQTQRVYICLFFVLVPIGALLSYFSGKCNWFGREYWGLLFLYPNHSSRARWRILVHVYIFAVENVFLQWWIFSNFLRSPFPIPCCLKFWVAIKPLWTYIHADCLISRWHVSDNWESHIVMLNDSSIIPHWVTGKILTTGSSVFSGPVARMIWLNGFSDLLVNVYLFSLGWETWIGTMNSHRFRRSVVSLYLTREPMGL